jgi:hypothetical protein
MAHHNMFSSAVQREIVRAQDALSDHSLRERRQQESRASYEAQALSEIANRIVLQRQVTELKEQIPSVQNQIETAELQLYRLDRLNEAPPEIGRLARFLATYLPGIGEGPGASTMTLQEDGEDEWTIKVYGCGFGVSSGSFDIDGVTKNCLRLFTINVVPGGRNNPDEEVDETILVRSTAVEMLPEIGSWLARLHACNLIDGLEGVGHFEYVTDSECGFQAA